MGHEVEVVGFLTNEGGVGLEIGDGEAVAGGMRHDFLAIQLEVMGGMGTHNKIYAREAGSATGVRNRGGKVKFREFLEAGTSKERGKRMKRFFLVAFYCLLAGPVLRAAEEPPAIPVVKTWGDLQDANVLTALRVPRRFANQTEPTVLGPEETFRAGIASDHAKAYGGLLFYFLQPAGVT